MLVTFIPWSGILASCLGCASINPVPRDKKQKVRGVIRELFQTAGVETRRSVQRLCTHREALEETSTGQS